MRTWNRRQASRWRIPTFVAASVLGHALVLVLVVATGLSRGCGQVPTGGSLGPMMGSTQEGPDTGWDAACLLDELLATSADAARCLVPSSEGSQACLGRVAERFSIGRLACRQVPPPLDVTLIDPAPLNPFAVQEPEDKKEKLEEARKAEEKPDEAGQVVETPAPAVEIRPDDAKFLSEHDQKVDKETKARKSAQAPEPPAQAAPATPPVQASPEVPPRPAEKGSGQEGKSSRGLAMRSETPGASDGHAPDEDGMGPRKGIQGQESPQSEEGGGGREVSPSPGAKAAPNLRPSQEMISRAVGGGTTDYLRDVDDGENTLINTKRWKYASFFNRVKRAVAQSWRPDEAFRLRDPSGRIYGAKNRLTILKVSLHPNGAIRDILIEKPCGVDFLDDEAVSAFRDAQPFPNPPQGLIDKDSKLITFRFGFFFEISDSPTFKVFRYSN